MENLEDRRLLAVVNFQQGVAGYEGQADTVLYSKEPGVNFGTEGSISPDQQDANGVRQGLLRFADIIGNDGSQVPLGAKINSATLELEVVNDSNSAMQMSLYRLQADWLESQVTWDSFGAIGGVQASEGEASDFPPDAILFDPDTSAGSPGSAGIFDVTRSLEYWAAGAENNGWLIESAATNGWDFRTKESAIAQRPRLTVDYNVPATNEFQVLNTKIVQAEGDPGSGEGGTSIAVIEIARMGDLSGPATVSYDIAAGTAEGADFVAESGTVDFAADQAFATISVTINGDLDIEGNETVEVTFSGGEFVAGRGTATVTIGDDDVLINEVLANVTSDVDETNREYIELIGTPGATLDSSYYFVVFEGEEEGDNASVIDGSALGVADFVAPLSGLQFGSNGLLVLAPNEWEYQAAAEADGTNVVNLASLDGAGGVLEDRSQTYALIRSPGGAIVEDIDYDTTGTYENDTNQAIGTGVGILDQLPPGAQVIDSVGVVEGGGGDRDRVLTPEALGHPGIHVHQPTGLTGSGGVTSDAVSRRIGQNLPNSIGVWFNGDIPDASSPTEGSSGPIQYANDTFFTSVVTPDGSVLTPGLPNELRTVFFSVDDQSVEIAEGESPVTVSLTIKRTGDLSEEVTVNYETIDFGSATADQDFTTVSNSLTFAAQQSSQEVMIEVLADSDSEGFESFRVDITSVENVSNPEAEYLITDGLSTRQGAVNGEAVVTISDADVSIATFQQGTNGYFGASDTTLDGEFTTTKFNVDPEILVDQVKGVGEDAPPVVRPQQGLIRFDNLFGDGAGMVPEGSRIFDAFLTVNVLNIASGADIRLFRMLQDWEESGSSWLDPQGSAGSSILNGVTPDDIEASAIPDAVVPEPGRSGRVQIPLNPDTFQSWANGSLDNFGWSIVSNSGSLWRIDSSDAFLSGTFRPELTILYTEPETTEGSVAGTFSLSVDDYRVNEDSTATITINRVGGSEGTVTVDWALLDGSGTVATDVSGSASGQVTFQPGDLFKTFDVVVNDDSMLETNETLDITISGDATFDRDMATLTIRDNDFSPFAGDLFLNEMWINSPGNDPPHEFVELKGVPGVQMGSLYYAAVEGLIGDREGSAEKVVDLGAFTNGTAEVDGNGYTVLTPDAEDFAFNLPSSATQIDALGSIATENVASQNDSTTYMLLYSPFTSLTLTEFDYDWNNDGNLELPPGVEIVDSVGVRVEGAADQLYGPSTNEAEFAVTDPDVDAISRFRTDTNRNEGDSWFGGDLAPGGDDYLLYEPGESFSVPVTGGALSPGEPNTGSEAQSPLVSLIDVSVNGNRGSGGTVVTLTFDGPVSQNNLGDGSPGFRGAGITILDGNGQEIPTITEQPPVSGFFSNTLTVTFTGPGVVDGQLPPGDYRLNFEGNALIGNARAIDVSNTGTQIGSQFFAPFTIDETTTDPGDFDGDGDLDCDDINMLSVEIASGMNGAAFDLTDDGMVNGDDLGEWLVLVGAANPDDTDGNPYLLGDATLDGVVDGQDFIVWNENKFEPVDPMDPEQGFCTGDFNADGVVDGQDFIIWNGNKFTNSSNTVVLPNITPQDSALAKRLAVEEALEGELDRVSPTEATRLASTTPVALASSDPTRFSPQAEDDAEERHVASVDLIFGELGL